MENLYKYDHDWNYDDYSGPIDPDEWVNIGTVRDPENYDYYRVYVHKTQKHWTHVIEDNDNAEGGGAILENKKPCDDYLTYYVDWFADAVETLLEKYFNDLNDPSISPNSNK